MSFVEMQIEFIKDGNHIYMVYRKATNQEHLRSNDLRWGDEEFTDPSKCWRVAFGMTQLPHYIIDLRKSYLDLKSPSSSSINSTQTSGVKKKLTPVFAPLAPIENASAVIAIDSAIPFPSDPNLKIRSTVPDSTDAAVASLETAPAVPSKPLVTTGGETPVLASTNLSAPTANAVNPEDVTEAAPASTEKLEKPPDWKGRGIAHATQDSDSDQSSDIEPDSSDLWRGIHVIQNKVLCNDRSH
ncbi:hypothetical protein YC2023_014192 [Brassica napus]